MCSCRRARRTPQPLGHEHSTLTGRYRIALPNPLRDRAAYRPLKTPPPDAAAASSSSNAGREVAAAQPTEPSHARRGYLCRSAILHPSGRALVPAISGAEHAMPDSTDGPGRPGRPESGLPACRGADVLCAAWGADAGPGAETRVHHVARHAQGLESALHRAVPWVATGRAGPTNRAEKMRVGAPSPRSPSGVAGEGGDGVGSDRVTQPGRRVARRGRARRGWTPSGGGRGRRWSRRRGR